MIKRQVIVVKTYCFKLYKAKRAKLNHHLGLRSMQKRIELLQGEFEIISKMNEGTIIKIVIPVENIPTREDFDYE